MGHMGFLARLIINAIALFAIASLHLFGVHADGLQPILIGALVLGLVNAIVRPILLVISCPLLILSLGIFTLVINGLIFYYGLKYIPGFYVPGFWAAFWAAIVMSIISWILSIIVRDREQEPQRQR